MAPPFLPQLKKSVCVCLRIRNIWVEGWCPGVGGANRDRGEVVCLIAPKRPRHHLAFTGHKKTPRARANFSHCLLKKLCVCVFFCDLALSMRCDANEESWNWGEKLAIKVWFFPIFPIGFVFFFFFRLKFTSLDNSQYRHAAKKNGLKRIQNSFSWQPPSILRSSSAPQTASLHHTSPPSRPCEWKIDSEKKSRTASLVSCAVVTLSKAVEWRKNLKQLRDKRFAGTMKILPTQRCTHTHTAYFGGVIGLVVIEHSFSPKLGSFGSGGGGENCLFK